MTERDKTRAEEIDADSLYLSVELEFATWQGMVVNGQVSPVQAFDYFREKIKPAISNKIIEALTRARGD